MEQGESGSPVRVPKDKLRGAFIPNSYQAYGLPSKNVFNKYIRWPYCPLTNYFGAQVFKESHQRHDRKSI